ncbi:pseudouridine synthase [Bacillus toyonensis]|nr:pseudouridine synthase [Bacillus toyonensis]
MNFIILNSVCEKILDELAPYFSALGMDLGIWTDHEEISEYTNKKGDVE